MTWGRTNAARELGAPGGSRGFPERDDMYYKFGCARWRGYGWKVRSCLAGCRGGLGFREAGTNGGAGCGRVSPHVSFVSLVATSAKGG